MIVAVNNPSGWQITTNYVYIGPSNDPGHGTTTNATYTVDSETTGHTEGDYVCHTGFRSGTHCGQVLDSDVTIIYSSTHSLHHAASVRGIACEGDSGGPVVVNHSAYGIEVAADIPSGECSSQTGVWYYEPINQIHDVIPITLNGT